MSDDDQPMSHLQTATTFIELASKSLFGNDDDATRALGYLNGALACLKLKDKRYGEGRER